MIVKNFVIDWSKVDCFSGQSLWHITITRSAAPVSMHLYSIGGVC
jgi:hypothetical protein|eukprot:COSAG02_NODE_472_length_21636_cov_767.911366_16_plen_45_part_00